MDKKKKKEEDDPGTKINWDPEDKIQRVEEEEEDWDEKEITDLKGWTHISSEEAEQIMEKKDRREKRKLAPEIRQDKPV